MIGRVLLSFSLKTGAGTGPVALTTQVAEDIKKFGQD
jgi:hypothetical protein